MSTVQDIRPIELTDYSRSTFWNRVQIGSHDECWPWTGKVHIGYGYLKSGGKNYIASRVAWYLANGRQPLRLICHRCDNPPCCNPSHLFEGTHHDNNRDTVAKRRHANSRQTHCKHGHEFTTENTYVWRTRRVCRACNRRNARKARG